MLARIAPLPILFAFLLVTPAALAQPTLTAPPTAAIGSDVTITVNGSSNPRDFHHDRREGQPRGRLRQL